VIGFRPTRNASRPFGLLDRLLLALLLLLLLLRPPPLPPPTRSGDTRRRATASGEFDNIAGGTLIVLLIGVQSSRW
jgi:hypothetical protein